jgi:hypothetical protein
VQVGALADGLLHAIGEIAERAAHALARDRQHRADAVLRYDDVDALRLEPAEHRALAALGGGGIEMKPVSVPAFLHHERRPRPDLVRMEAALDHEPAREIPVQRLDVLLARGGAGVETEVAQGFEPVHPPAHTELVSDGIAAAAHVGSS